MRKLKRREFITLLGGAAAAWPLAVRAQQSEKVRRIGFVHDYVGSDPEGQRQAAAFREALRKLGWVDGENVQIDYRSLPLITTCCAAMRRRSCPLGPTLCSRQAL